MPNREDERWRNVYPHPPACTCAECTSRRLEKYYARARHRNKFRLSRLDIGRWLTALVGVFLLSGSVTYFQYFAGLLRHIGIQNEQLLFYTGLLIEVLGGVLVILAIFVKHRAKAVKVSVLVFLVLLAGLLVWHTLGPKA